MKLPLSKKAIAEIRRQRTLSLGGNQLGGVVKTPRSKPPRAISLATIRCMTHEPEHDAQEDGASTRPDLDSLTKHQCL
jgi:hypothetical protein